jgi:hypothetical protein
MPSGRLKGSKDSKPRVRRWRKRPEATVAEAVPVAQSGVNENVVVKQEESVPVAQAVV